MDSAFSYVGLIIILLSSLIYCFYGYRFFKFLLALAGSIIFGTVSWNISAAYFTDKIYIAIIITVIAASIGAWLFHKLFKIATFLYGAAAGLSLSPVILTYISEPPDWCKWGLPIGCALVGGIILLLSHRIVLITMTSASGALYFTISGLLLLVNWEVISNDILEKPDKVQTGLFLLCFAVLFISGWIYQLKDKETVDS